MAVYKQKNDNSRSKLSKASTRPVNVIRGIQPVGMVRKNGNSSNHKVTITVDRTTGSILAIKTDRVFAQIARMSRNPKKEAEKNLLANALNDAIVSLDGAGGRKRMIRGYVPMSEEVAKRCFGKGLEQLPKSSVVHMVVEKPR